MGDFNFVKNGTWGDYLLIDSKRLSEVGRYIRENNVKNVELNLYHGYELKDIQFLVSLKDVIEGVNVIQGSIDLKGLDSLINLKQLNISDEMNCSIEFSAFKKLERCSILWHKNLKNISTCSTLKEIVIKKINDKDINKVCEGLRSVESMTLIQPRIKNLDFIAEFSSLKSLEIYYSTTLEDITILSGRKSLKRLLLDHCKRVRDYKALASLTEIEYLGINDAGEIPTLSFVKDLKKLKHLSFVGTNVLDGNLSFCYGVDYVGHDNKKHYSSIPRNS